MSHPWKTPAYLERLLSKMMKDDRVDLSVSAGYTAPSHTYTSSSHTMPADVVALQLPGLTAVGGGKVVKSDARELSASLESALDAFLAQLNQNATDPLLMNAYLNWVLLDNQFNFVEEGSGFTQVPYRFCCDCCNDYPVKSYFFILPAE